MTVILGRGHAYEKDTLVYFKPSACLLANQVYKDAESHRLWRQGGDVLETRECMLPKWELLVGSSNFSAAQLSWAHPCHWSCTQGTKMVDPQSSVVQVLFNAFFSALQVFCSTLLSQKTCGEDLSGIGGRSWMRLEASIVCFSHVGGSGQMVLGAWDRNSRLPQQLPGWLSSPIQDPHYSPQEGEGPRKAGPKIVCCLVDPNGLLPPLGHSSSRQR